MDWVQHVIALTSAVIGGMLVILSERLARREDARERRSETIVSLYTEFFVCFQMALHHNESYWADLRADSAAAEGEKSRESRLAAETALREAAWRLLLRERDDEQQARIESLARAFDEENEDIRDPETVAAEYPRTAERLRTEIREIVDRMQDIHRQQLDL
ncbi:MAG: hypothetical protein ACF8Q5_01335 [Phycisphaerales bacterium JB040]